MPSTEKPDSGRELLPAYSPDKYLQVTGFWRLRHCEHFFVVVFLLGAALGLTLDEQVVEHWSWVTPFVQTVAQFVPVVDSFWRVSPFPTVAGLLPAIVWLTVFLSGVLAPITVRHLRFPLMYEPLSFSTLLVLLLFSASPARVVCSWRWRSDSRDLRPTPFSMAHAELRCAKSDRLRAARGLDGWSGRIPLGRDQSCHRSQIHTETLRSTDACVPDNRPNRRTILARLLLSALRQTSTGVRNWPLAVITCVRLRPEAVVKLGQAIPCSELCGGSK